MKNIGIGLIGLGVVGRGVISLLQKNNEIIRKNLGFGLSIVAVSNRTKDERFKLLNQPCLFYENPLDVVDDKQVDIVIELIGGTTTAWNIIMKAFTSKKPIVSANKALIAQEIDVVHEMSLKHSTPIHYEAAVAGAIPIIQVLKNSTISNEILEIKGILNGTCNYILSKMTNEKSDFTNTLNQAQELGFAESDPTFDIDGWDAFHKSVILSYKAFGISFDQKKCIVKGIRNISNLDIKYSSEFGYRIKLLSRIKFENNSLFLRVEPALLQQDSFLAQLDGELNGIELNGNYSGNLFFGGRGAGGNATASAVVADCINAAKGINNTHHDLNKIKINTCDINQDSFSKFYIRMNVFDKSGTLTQVTKLMSEYGADIENISQFHEKQNETTVPLAMIIKEYHLIKLNKLIKALEKLETVCDEIIWYPVY